MKNCKMLAYSIARQLPTIDNVHKIRNYTIKYEKMWKQDYYQWWYAENLKYQEKNKD